MLFPIPLPFDISDNPNAPFKISIGFTPKLDGFSLDASRIFYVNEDGAKVAPSWMSGSYSKGQVPVGRIPPSATKLIPLQKDVSTALGLEFNIAPPDPSQTFVIEIEGLLLGGKPYPVPRIRFEKATGIWPDHS